MRSNHPRHVEIRLAVPADAAARREALEALLAGRPTDAPGTCVTCVMEGARPVLAEIQALAVSSPAGNPRRTSNGFDYNRFAMPVSYTHLTLPTKLEV